MSGTALDQLQAASNRQPLSEKRWYRMREAGELLELAESVEERVSTAG